MPDLIGTPADVRARLERLYADGELVSLTPPTPAGRGQVRVRVELAPTRPRQHPDTYPDTIGALPRQGWQVPAAVFGGVVAAAVALVALLWWAVAWAADHVALILGTAAALLIGAALLARLARGWGGDEHPCNR